MTPATFARELGASVRAGRTLRLAAREIAAASPDDVDATGVARRVALGASVPSAVRARRSWGSDAAVIATVLEVAEETGGDSAALLDAIAAEFEGRDAAGSSAAMHAAGVTMSARLVALLPLLFVPLTVGTNTGFLDATGVALLVVGAGLVLAGYRWLMRLVPRPSPEPDVAVMLALALAVTLRAGASPQMALARFASAIGPLKRPVRLMRMGVPWSAALGRSGDEGLIALGEATASATHFGTPLVEALDRFRAARSAVLQRGFETEIRKAPVRMVIPLTTCILPAFALLGAAPFLRSLGGL